MASDDIYRPPPRAWRPEAQPTEEATATGPQWRKDATPSPTAAFRSKNRVRVVVLALIAIVCAGLFLWVAFWLSPPRPATLVLIGAGYEENLAVPANVYGRESLTTLADLTHSSTPSLIRRAGLFRLKQDPLELRRDSAWDNGLDTFREQTIILYFALHGGCDLYFDAASRSYRLDPYLLPHDADGRDEERNRLRLKGVLDRLEKMPKDKNKLLILDATQVAANWSHGMLQNDFARGLRELAPQIEAVPNLVVLSASDVDQRSWVADEWRLSAFAHYVNEGLRGAADDDRTSRISALKLFNYVRTGVERWARINREALQTPVMLPAGREGERRAQAMYLTMVQETYRVPEPKKSPPFTPPPELQQAWEDYRRLAEQVPAPAVYSPHLWRLYQSVLLRHEHLLVAGDPTSATNLGSRLHELRRELDRARRLELLSFQNTFTMPAAAGVVSADSPQLVGMLNTLWDAKPADARKQWADMQKKVPGDTASRRVLALKLTELIYDRAVENPTNNLEKVYQLFQVVNDPARPRPAETHFLVMLHRDLPQKPLQRDYSLIVRRALMVRRQAERTALSGEDVGYPYTEHVSLWFSPQVAAADVLRRRGEDLLFASDKASWDQADKYLIEADQQYKQAQATAESLRKCLTVRDQLQAVLPYYSAWLAQRRQAANPEREQVYARLLTEAEDLWDQMYRLVDQLEPARSATERPRTVDFKELEKVAVDIDKRYRALQRQWTESWREATAVDSPAAWHAAHDALEVPVANATQRMQLLTNCMRISRELLFRTAQSEAKIIPVKPETTRLVAQESARRNGRMALASLGRSWFDSLRGRGRESFQEVSHRLSEFAVEDQWWVSLGRAGDQVGIRFRHLPIEIEQQLNASRKTVDRPKVMAALRSADQLARQLTGDGAAEVKENPGNLYRRVLVQELLLNQAQRSFADHWYAEEEDAREPYYRTAGRLYLQDAVELMPKANAAARREQIDLMGDLGTSMFHLLDVFTQFLPNDLRKGMRVDVPIAERFKDMQDKLNVPGELVLGKLPPLAVTSEQRFDVEFRLQPRPGSLVPPGQPVFWVEPNDAVQAVDPPPNTRLVRSYGLDRSGQAGAGDRIKITFTSPMIRTAEIKPPPAPRKERTQLLVRGLFRGQRIDLQTPVDLYPLAETVISQPPLPPQGSIALRATRIVHQEFGAAAGAVAFVVDCSGSMGEEPGRPYTPTTKYNEVTAALRSVLQTIPKGTSVSVWVFGQAVGARKVAENADETVRRIQDPVAWDPTNAGLLKQVMAKVQYPALEPWNESPIVRSILKAKDDVQGAAGFKTIMVLTDGMDNRFGKDRELNPRGRDIPSVLRDAFKDSGIVLNIIGFKTVSDEETAQQRQFKVVEEMSPPGSFITVKEVSQLGFTLEKAVRQTLRYKIDHEDNAPIRGIPPDGLDVSKLGANDQWIPGGLQPGGYKVRVYTPYLMQKSVVIQPGDLLIVQLANLGRRLELSRGMYSRDDFPGKPWLAKQGWRLAVLQNQRVDDRGLRMLTTLEKTPEADEAILQVVKPRETWIELKPRQDSDGSPYSVRLAYQAGYPAPAWGVDVAAWPMRTESQVPALPDLRVWFSPDLEAPAAAVLERGPNLKSLLGLTGQAVTVDGDNAVIESVAVEKHYVETKPGELEEKSCLVVRMGHLPDRPVRARVRGLRLEGQEHRYYSEAGKYTGIFWPVTETEAKNALQSLSVISVNGFKRDAEQRGFFFQMDKLGPPQASEVRPRPPLPTK